MSTGIIPKLSAKVSKFFKWSEFTCKCKGQYCKGESHVTAPLLRVLHFLRVKTGKAISVISGIRCLQWNKIQGGASNSQHLYGAAADIRLTTYSDVIEAYKFVIRCWLNGEVPEISHCYIVRDKNGNTLGTLHIDTGYETDTRTNTLAHPFTTDGFMGLK